MDERKQAPLAYFGRLLATYLRPLAPQVAALAALLAGSTALQLAGPQVVRAFIDAATGAAGTDAGQLQSMAALYIGLALGQQALAVGATYVSERVGWSATNSLREHLLQHCLHLDLAFHKGRTPGELIERVDGDVTALGNFFSQFVVQLVGNLLLFVGVVALLWGVDWRPGLALSVFAAVTFAVMGRMRAVTVPYWRRARQASADLFGYLEERLGGTEDIRANGAAGYAVQGMYRHLRDRILTNCRARVIGTLQWGVPDILASVQIAVSFVITVVLYRAGEITLGTAVMIYFYTWLSFRPLHMMTNQMEDLQKAGAGVIRIRDLLETKSALDDPASPATLASGPLSVEFDTVSFDYGDEQMVLHDLSFRIAPGAVLGLLGRTGSGKTTISRLIFRLYDPTAGAVRLGGVDVRQVKRAALRQRVGMVTQDVQLFRATVRDNVTFFDGSFDDGRIVAALEGLGLADWYRSLPQGLDTVLGGADGAGVSAGEAQLLAFTRAFLRDPGLVILDEASSRLDPATERLVDRAVQRLLAGRTGIIIAHRLATILRADEVLILDSGRILEAGARATLVADPTSHLSSLLRTGLDADVARPGDGMHAAAAGAGAGR